MQDLFSFRQPDSLAPILERTAAIRFGMASEPQTGALLRTLAASKPGGRLLELGTGTGVATAWLLDGMDAQAQLVSVDVDLSVQQIARDCLRQSSRVSLLIEDAVSFLKRQPAGSFDLVFADALAGKYEAIEEALRVVSKGGFYIVDDLLPQPHWPEGHAAKVPDLLDRLARHPDFSVLPMAWATGLVVAVRTTNPIN